MPLIQVVAILIAAGTILWLINIDKPMDKKTKTNMNVIVVIAMVLWVLGIFGFLGDIANIHIGR